jgi:uncharacterized protein
VESERLHVLDILRGFALLGMIVVHFYVFATLGFIFNMRGDYAMDGGAIGATIRQAIGWFVTDKAHAMFAVLLGVGFAIQLRRADTRGEEVRWRFLRRLLGVAGFGVVTAALSGAIDLIGYAYSGVWLLFVRRWSTRALLVALLASATFAGVWNVAVGSYQWATMGVERANAVYQSPRKVSPARQAAAQELRGALQGTSFSKLASASVVSRVYWGPHTDLWGDWQQGSRGSLLGSLGGFNMTFFLIGLLAPRLGVFEWPADHRRLLFAVMLAGAALWAVAQWQLSKTLWPATWVIPVVRVARPVEGWFLGDTGAYLALTYIAAITWLVGFSKAWERRLTAIFAAAGRLALTNYIVQFAVLSVLVNQYGFGLRGKLTPQLGAATAVILFATLAVFSRWWIARFRLGPAEWVLRCLTYARLQPIRRPIVQGV